MALTEEASLSIGFSTLVVFGMALAAVAASPGPSIAALVSRVLQQGIGSVLPFLAAMWIGEALWFTMAVLGLSAIAENFHMGAVALKYLGIAYLLWLALKMWRTPVADGDEVSIATSSDGWKLFGAGLAITIGNPKIMVFYLALLPSLVDLRQVGVSEWAALVGILICVLVVIDMTWAVFAASARKLFRRPALRRATHKISAGLMAGAAGLFAFKS